LLGWHVRQFAKVFASFFKKKRFLSPLQLCPSRHDCFVFEPDI